MILQKLNEKELLFVGKLFLHYHAPIESATRRQIVQEIAKEYLQTTENVTTPDLKSRVLLESTVSELVRAELMDMSPIEILARTSETKEHLKNGLSQPRIPPPILIRYVIHALKLGVIYQEFVAKPYELIESQSPKIAKRQKEKNEAIEQTAVEVLTLLYDDAYQEHPLTHSCPQDLLSLLISIPLVVDNIDRYNLEGTNPIREMRKEGLTRITDTINYCGIKKRDPDNS